MYTQTVMAHEVSDEGYMVSDKGHMMPLAFIIIDTQCQRTQVQNPTIEPVFLLISLVSSCQ